MRGIAILMGLIVLCGLGWLAGAALAPGAIGMAVGMLFGVLGGAVVAMLLLASNRQRVAEDEDENNIQPVYQLTPTVTREGEFVTDDIEDYLAAQVELRGGRIEMTNCGYRHIWADGTRKVYWEAA